MRQENNLKNEPILSEQDRRTARQLVRSVCVRVIDSKDAKRGEILHAADLLCLLMGLGSRVNAGRAKKDVRAKLTNPSKTTETQKPKPIHGRTRLEEMMTQVREVSNEEAK